MEELKDIELIIIKSLDQTASLADLATLKNWMEASEVNRQHYFKMKDMWDASRTYTDYSAKQAWGRVNNRITQRHIPKWTVEFLKIASVAIVAVLLSYLVFNIPTETELYSNNTTVEVPNGSQSTIYLNDGTKVKLNAGSKLIYPNSFNGDTRQVQLSGEGYFEVTHNPEHPFVVSAGEIEVRVLGTEFNVMAYPEYNRIETTLIDGKVALNRIGANTKPMVLKPGQKATYSNGKLSLEHADIQLETNWTKNSFYFKSTPFSELVMRLERWYAVDIEYKTEDFKDITFTGKFRNNETIWQVLDAIQITTAIRYKSENEKIHITLTK